VLAQSRVGDFPGDEALKVLAADDEIVAMLFVLRIVDGVFSVRLRIEEGGWGFGLLGERVDSGDGRSIRGWTCCRKIPRRCKQTNPLSKSPRKIAAIRFDPPPPVHLTSPQPGGKVWLYLLASGSWVCFSLFKLGTV
jgi:hypothetical protein